MAMGIYVVAIVMWALLCMWTWNSEKLFEGNKIKVLYIAGGILVLGMITLVVFNISKAGVLYPNDKMIAPVRKMILMIFTPINGFIVMPYVAVQIGNLKSGQINETELKKRGLILLVIFFIAIIFECLYFKNIQNGILSIYNR